LKISNTFKKVAALALIAATATTTLILTQPMPIDDVQPLITGKWLHNPGACIGKLPRNGFFDVSIFTTNPTEVVVNKIVLDEGRISELDSDQIEFAQEKIDTVFAICEKISQPKSTPTMFHYKHPLKEFSVIYYPEEDLLIQTNKSEVLLFQRLDSIDTSALQVVDSI
jgi:hypothetical protein